MSRKYLAKINLQRVVNLKYSTWWFFVPDEIGLSPWWVRDGESALAGSTVMKYVVAKLKSTMIWVGCTTCYLLAAHRLDLPVARTLPYLDWTWSSVAAARILPYLDWTWSSEAFSWGLRRTLVSLAAWILFGCDHVSCSLWLGCAW
jgi:hypothetical protein